MTGNTGEHGSDDETAKRRDEALRRALNTPPQPKLTGNRKAVNPPAEANGGKPEPPASES